MTYPETASKNVLTACDTDLSGIRNRNEAKVAELIPKILDEFPDFQPQSLDIEDIYALSLNSLPARYKQKGSIVLREPVKEGVIMERIREAVLKVKDRPNYTP